MKKLLVGFFLLGSISAFAQSYNHFVKLKNEAVITIKNDITFKDENWIDITIPSEDGKYELYIKIEEPLAKKNVPVLKANTVLKLSIVEEYTNNEDISFRVNNYTGFNMVDINRADGEDITLEEIKDIKFEQVDFRMMK